MYNVNNLNRIQFVFFFFYYYSINTVQYRNINFIDYNIIFERGVLFKIIERN